MKTAAIDRTAEQQVQSFIAKFGASHQVLIRAVRSALHKYFPTGAELVYDNYNFFVLGYGPTERPSDAVISMACGANGVGLCFIQGAKLPDPKEILQGSGNQTRFVRLETVDVLKRPEVDELISLAIARARAPFPKTGRRKLIIRSISARQRPRRRAAKA